jgi:4-amino-4-deoxy-L-arabinose transferase-like glycosyltransferase
VPLRDYALLLLLCLALYLPGLSVIPPIDRDEARFAQASRQMLESRDFVTIRFQNELRLKKPAGIYWLQAASAALFDKGGEPRIWPYRLPSVIGAALGTLLTAMIGARLFGRRAGLLAGILMATSLLLGIEAHLATTDAVEFALIAVAQLALAEAWLTRDRVETLRHGMAILFWLALGLGILVKGPINILVTGLTATSLCILDRRVAWLGRLRPWPYGLLALAVVAPWGIAIMISTKGAFLAQSVGHDLLGKVAAAQEAHGAPPGYYLALFWGCFWPASLLAGLAIPWIWRQRREQAAQFCLAWLIPSWIVFELVPTKLPHYTLPLYPALALLAAAAALAPLPRPTEWRGRLLFGLLVAGWIALTLAFAAALTLLPVYLGHGPNGLKILAGLVTAILELGAMGFYFGGRRQAALGAAIAGILLFSSTLYEVVLPGLDRIWINERVADAVAATKPCPKTTAVLAGISEPSFVFLLGTATRFADGKEAAELLLADPCALALVDQSFLPSFLARLEQAGKTADPLAKLDGINISRGKRVELTLYARAHAGQGQ